MAARKLGRGIAQGAGSIKLPVFPGEILPSIAPTPVRPPSPPPAIQGLTDKSETGFFTFKGPAQFPQDVPVVIYQTSRTWSGIDVYVDPRIAVAAGGAFQAWIRTWLYAITGSSRALVATGWTRAAPNTVANNANNLSRRALSFRGLAERFEVQALLTSFNPLIANQVEIAVYAGNETSSVDPLFGMTSLLSNVQQDSAALNLPLATIVTGVPRTYQTEVMGFEATNVTAGLLFLQFFDAEAASLAPGSQPVFSFAIPANSTVVVGPDQMRGYRFNRDGCSVGVSSTGPTYTGAGAGSVFYTVFGR